MAKPNWFQTGEEGRKRLKKEKAEQELKRSLRGPMRWWLAKDTEGDLTFVDTPKFYFHEHGIRIDGSKFPTFFTCIKDWDECPPCENGDNPSYVLVCTIISHKPYTSKKDEKTYNHQKMLLVLKGAARDKVLRQIGKRDGDLRMCVYNVARGSGTTECGTGEDFDFQIRTTKKKLLGLKPPEVKESDDDWLKPFDYAKIFAPKTPAEIRELLGYGPSEAVGSREDEEEPDNETEEGESKGSEEGEGESDEDETPVGSDEDDEPEEKPEKPAKPKTVKEDTTKKPKNVAKSIKGLF